MCLSVAGSAVISLNWFAHACHVSKYRSYLLTLLEDRAYFRYVGKSVSLKLSVYPKLSVYDPEVPPAVCLPGNQEKTLTMIECAKQS